MYRRHMHEDSMETAAQLAEKMRRVLSRAVVLMVICTAAPYAYEYVTGGSLHFLAGGDAASWETMLWVLWVGTIFTIIGLVGVAGICTRGT